MTSVPDVARLVARRSSILAALRHTARTKRDLASSLDSSRSTVDRAIRELEQAGLVERTDGALALTLPGVLALESHERHTAELAGIEDVQRRLETLPADLDVPPALFRDPTVDAPNRHAPQRPTDPLAHLLEDATHVKHYATGIRPEYGDTYWDVVFDDGRLDVVATNEVVTESIRANQDILQEALATNGFTLAETDESRPYSIVIGDDRDVCVLLYEDHSLQMVIRNDTPGTIHWALETFESLSADATPVANPSLDT